MSEVDLVELKKKFQGEIDQADWEMLAPHHERQTLFKVSRDLDIFDVAIDLAIDNVDEVKKYLESNQLTRLEDDEVLEYAKNKNKFFANFLVIQPYVIFQEYSSN